MTHYWVKGRWGIVFQELCLPVGTTHMWGLCMTFTQVAWPKPGATMEAPILALPPSTSILGLGLSFLICHIQGARLASPLSSILSLKFYSHHSQEKCCIVPSTILYLSRMQGYDPGGKLKKWRHYSCTPLLVTCWVAAWPPLPQPPLPMIKGPWEA